jgi:hypothetical protein
MQRFGGNVPVHSARVCVIYDREGGHIRHIHEVITLEGGREPSEREIEAHAMEMVKRKGDDPHGLGVLHVSSDRLDRRQAYRVDPSTRTLVPKPAT